jgi:hypothetical protein
LEQYSFTIYFSNASWCWVVQDVSSSGLISIPQSHYLKDCNLRKGLKICAEVTTIPVNGATSAYYLDSFCWANFMAKNKWSIHWVFFLAKTCITPPM